MRHSPSIAFGESSKYCKNERKSRIRKPQPFLTEACLRHLPHSKMAGQFKIENSLKITDFNLKSLIYREGQFYSIVKRFDD
jgi:hypothetical protein